MAIGNNLFAHLGDAAFHVRNARWSLTQAKGEVSTQEEYEAVEQAIVLATQLGQWASRQVRNAKLNPREATVR